MHSCKSKVPVYPGHYTDVPGTEEYSFFVICKNNCFTSISTPFSTTFAVKAQNLFGPALFPQFLCHFKGPWCVASDAVPCWRPCKQQQVWDRVGLHSLTNSTTMAWCQDSQRKEGWMTQEALVSRMFKQQLGNEVSTLPQNHGEQFIHWPCENDITVFPNQSLFS